MGLHDLAGEAEKEGVGVSFQFIDIPRPVGFWQIGGVYGLRVGIYRQPRRLTRWLCKWLLEWEWVPNP